MPRLRKGTGGCGARRFLVPQGLGAVAKAQSPWTSGSAPCANWSNTIPGKEAGAEGCASARAVCAGGGEKKRSGVFRFLY